MANSLDNDFVGSGADSGSAAFGMPAGDAAAGCGETAAPRRPWVRIITMGCAKNEADSDRMRAALESAGFYVETSSLVGAAAAADDDGGWDDSWDDGDADWDAGDDWGSGDGEDVADAAVSGSDAVGLLPDVTLINTCSFITGATQESIDAIFAVVEERSELTGGRPLGEGGSKIVVAGCIPSRYGDGISREIPEVDAFVSVEDEGRIVSVLSDLIGFDSGSVSEGAPAPRTTGQSFAYVKISDGCDRFCSFCTIPYIRGRYESRPARQIIDEVGFLVEGGTREIVLVGQDTGIWGDDLTDRAGYEPLERPTLAALMEYLAQAFPQTWIRVMYLQPERTDDELLAVMARYPNVCSYLDIPLQHASAKVVSEMNRKGGGAEYLELLKHVRAEVPGITLRTTVISGFPGETEEESDELVGFMREAAFDFAGVFEYSREDGTVAGERDDQVPEEVAVERANEVREAIEECGVASAAARVGKVYEVLVCGVADVDDEFDASSAPVSVAGSDGLAVDPVATAAAGSDMAAADSGELTTAPIATAAGSDMAAAAAPDVPVALWGRAQFQAPEVDSVIYLEGSPALVGSFVEVEIVGSMGYDLEGEVLA